MRLWIVLFVAISFVGCGNSEGGAGGTTEDATRVLRFSAIPDEKPTERSERFQPVADYLAGALGVKVEYVSVDDYSASVQAFKTGDIQFAWFGGLSGDWRARASSRWGPGA